MALVPGLSPNINLNMNGEAPPEPDNDVVVIAADELGDVPEFDQSGAVVKIEHDDGSVTVSLDGKPIIEAEKEDNKDWFRNLLNDIGDREANSIVDDLLRGIADDIESRKDWVEDRAQGIKLLGLRIEVPNVQGASDGAPVEGMSKVRHPLLQEAVLRFQANARSELLPTDGPVKIRNDNNNADLGQDQLANALEQDINHYLTVTASEYYPDTDRMLLMLGFGGMAFKKVYFCPLRQRPVSETVDAEDLIVNNAATDLKNALRITHRSFMKQSTVKRFQILGIYSDIDLSPPQAPKQDSVKEEKSAQQGISVRSRNPEDNDREIYECYCELNIPGFEHKMKGKETGLELPYRVTIDLSTRKALSIVRNYKDPEGEDLPEARTVFVKYTFVPGFGFCDIGLLNILGNTTNAVTAAWRELLDAGMYAVFPGFLMADVGARQNTNIFRIPPGGGSLVKTGGMKISDAIMPLPYREPSPALMQLVDSMTQTGMRVGGTSEQQVGEGKQDAPVGTTLALIDQATKVQNAVHKRMHAAQAEEFRLLVECFRENPQSFWKTNKTPAYPWDEQTFIKAINDCDLTPQADPNTASQTQRIMKITALKQLQAASPDLYDPIAVDIAALQAIGWSNPQQFMVPLDALNQKPKPEEQAKMSELAIKKQQADAGTAVAQAKVQETQVKIQSGFFSPKENVDGGPQGQIDTPVDEALAHAKMLDSQAKLMDSQTKVHEAQNRMRETDIKHHDLMSRLYDSARESDMKTVDSVMDNQNRAADRESKEQQAVLNLAKEVMLHKSAQHHELEKEERSHEHELKKIKATPKPVAAKPAPKKGK